MLLPESQVFIFEDGQSAPTNIQEISPDIIFLDLFMPILDGWEFLADLKKMGVPYNLIAYIVTSSLYNFDKKEIYKYQFVKRFIIKPFTKMNLEKIIEDYTNEYLSVNY